NGPIGPADVTVTLADGRSETLEAAYEYQEPVQAVIRTAARTYDVALDPTGTYLVTAAGYQGVLIYNVDASVYTTRGENPLNLDDLRRRIDEDGDGWDDRIVARISLGGARALGVDTYFERGVDR